MGGGGVNVTIAPFPFLPPLSPPHNVAIAMATPTVRSCRVTTARGHRPRGDTDTGGVGGHEWGEQRGGGLCRHFHEGKFGGGDSRSGTGGDEG